MKKITYLITLLLAVTIVSCNNGKESTDALQAKVDSLTAVVTKQDLQLKEKSDSIGMLRFPADQRLAKIKQLIAAENFSEAQSSIASLQSAFPNSPEAEQCNELKQTINAKIDAIAAEKARIKALGFKALKTQTKVEIGYNTVTFGSFSIGTKFTHDVYGGYGGSSWFEHTADRGNKYISCPMDVTSSSKDPSIPTIALYSIHGDQLILQGSFRVEMGRWQDYGTYLGNEHDIKNDFSKVSTVKFKLGLELSESTLSQPYMVVLKKENTQSRHYERMRNPPIYYSGAAGYPSKLSMENFADGGYVALKIANL